MRFATRTAFSPTFRAQVATAATLVTLLLLQPELVDGQVGPRVTGCKPPPSVITPTNGYVQSPVPQADANGLFQFGATYRFACNQGYTSAGQGTVTCLTTGNWEFAPMYCTSTGGLLRNCSAPPTPTNSFTWYPVPMPTSFLPEECVKYRCQEGYGIQYACPDACAQVTCKRDGTWTKVRFRCVRKCWWSFSFFCLVFCVSFYFNFFLIFQSVNPVTCPPPPLPTFWAGGNGTAFAEYQPGAIVQYGCQSGYKIFGTIRCLEGGYWTGQNTICQPSNFGLENLNYDYNSGSSGASSICVAPNGPLNSVQSVSSPIFSVGEFIEYKCNNGYVATGRMQCLSDGTWNGAEMYCNNGPLQNFGPAPATTARPTPPIFIANAKCGRPPTPTNALIMDEARPDNQNSPVPLYPPGSSFSYRCQSGFQIQGSNVIRCQNNGQWTTSPTCTA